MNDLGLPRGEKKLVLFPVPVGPEMDNPTVSSTVSAHACGAKL